MMLRNQNGWRARLLQLVRNLPARLVKLRRGLKLESGGSLPAALITLAVGSMLLTPFLSFVSTRSLGTRAAGETFSKQYAADAGVEFGIWSLLNDLNDLAFRIQVDSSIGTAQPLPFPSPINGYIPSLSVTGILIGNWYPREFASGPIGKGGSLAYDGVDKIYALWGDGSTTFGYYSISESDPTKKWVSLSNTPNDVGRGGALVYPGGNFLYALRGDNKDNFWRYNISTGNWEDLEDTPNRVSQGGSLVYPGEDYIYALRGNSNKFWRYNISIPSGTWSSRSNTPESVGYGADLIATGENTIYALRGANNTNFWRYNIGTNTWSTLQNTLSRVTNGGALAYYSGDYIYALQGKSTGFWRYAVTMNSWTELTGTLDKVGDGGSLVVTHSLGGFAFRGGGNTDFWEFEVTPPQYDISSQAGSVDTDAKIEIDGSTNTILFWDID